MRSRKELIVLALRLLVAIVVPLMLFGFLGFILDRKFNSTPTLIFAGLFLAFLTSTLWVMVLAMKISKKYFH